MDGWMDVCYLLFIYSSVALVLHSQALSSYSLFSYPISRINLEWQPFCADVPLRNYSLTRHFTDSHYR